MNKSIFRNTICHLLLALLLSVALSAQEADFSDIRFYPDNRLITVASSADSITDTFEAEQFLELALIASGTDEENTALLIESAHDIFAQLLEYLSPFTTEAERTDQTLHFLYNTLLSSYSENQTLVDVAIETGTYNCVSSAVLFMYFMKKQSVTISAVETPLHAFCTVQIDGQTVDVETTNPFGYNPGHKKEIESDSLSQKKFVSVPAKKYANRHTVNDRRIISLIYNNRIASLQRQKKDSFSIGLACDANQLQNNSLQSQNLLAQCVYNTAASFTKAKQDEKGIALVQKAKQLFGNNDIYIEYNESAINNIIAYYANSDKYQEAFSALQKYQSIVSSQKYDSFYANLAISFLYYEVNHAPFAQSHKEIIQNQSHLPPDEYEKLVSYAYSLEASNMSKNNDWLSAASFLEQGLEEVPKNSTLTKQRNTYRNNYAIDVHNKAATFANTGDYDSAEKVILQGLELVSESSILKNDLKRIQSNQNSRQ